MLSVTSQSTSLSVSQSVNKLTIKKDVSLLKK